MSTAERQSHCICIEQPRHNQTMHRLKKSCWPLVLPCQSFTNMPSAPKVKVHSDHKCPETVTAKPPAKAPARLQRMLLQLQKYDIKLMYTKHKGMFIADTLSKAAVDTQHIITNLLAEEKVCLAQSPSVIIYASRSKTALWMTRPCKA